MTRLVRKYFRINGARGSAMLFKGLMAIIFGLAFFSPWQVIPPPPSGLALLHDFVPLEVWALGWYVAGVWLIVGAFRQNQSKPMGLYAAMLFIWFGSYLTTIIIQLFTQGYSNLWFVCAIYGTLLGSALSVARLINAPADSPVPSLERRKTITGQLEVVIKEESGDDT